MIAIATALASCSNNETIGGGAANEMGSMIGFQTYSVISTTPELMSAPVESNTAFQTTPGKFDVSAFIDITDVTSAYMADVEISYQTSAWDYTTAGDAEFWPSDINQTLDFYATANVTGATKSKADGITIASYTVDTIITAQPDFMYAAAPNAYNLGGSTTSSNITTGGDLLLHFRHAMTQLDFTAQLVGTEYNLTISKIEVCNINPTGAFAMAAEKSTVTDSCTWVPATTAAVDLVNYAVTPSADITVTAGATSTAASKIAIQQGDNRLLLMPQTITAWDGASDATATSATGGYLVVTCTLWKEMQDTSGNTVKIYYIGSATGDGVTAIPLASIADNGGTDAQYPEWVGGRKITYNLMFNADPTSPTGGGGKDPETGENTLIPISFDTTVEDYDNVTPATNLGM